MPNQQKKKKKANQVPASQREISAASAFHPSSGIEAIALQLAVFVVAFVIVASRRPDAVFNAQFWAEDGMVWYADAYNFGLRSLLMQQGSYLHVFTRLIALVSLLFPLSLAPLVTNFCAITVKILPVNVFLSSRFGQIGLPMRLLASFIYLALPNSREVHANLTAIQWHLALLACVLILAEPAAAWGWRLFAGIVLVMISLDAAIIFALVPMAAALWWKRRNPGDTINLALLLPGAAIQALSVFLTWHSRQLAPNGASFARLITILGRQIFLPSLVGMNTVFQFALNASATFTEIIATAIGLALVLYTLFRGPFRLKLFVLFAVAVLALCLARPLAGPPELPQWAWLCVPGRGNRYDFLPMIAFLAALLWMTTDNANPKKLRYFVLALLFLLPVGVSMDWQFAPFKDYQFKEYAAEFEKAPPGTTVEIPLNPGPNWKITLTKR